MSFLEEFTMNPGRIGAVEIDRQVSAPVAGIPPELLCLINVALLRGRLTVEQLADFVKSVILNGREEAIEGLATIEEAIAILGESAVVTARRSAEKWGLEGALEPQFVGYTASDLRETEETNKRGHRYRLIYCNGIAVADLIEMRSAVNLPQVVRKENCADWFLQLSGKFSANQGSRPGYYLIDFAAHYFEKRNFSGQEAAIGEMGAEFERPEDAVLLEAAFTLMMANGEQPFATADHWGWHTWEGMNIVFGPSQAGGIEIGFLSSSARCEKRKRPLGACVLRLPRHILRAKLRR